MSASGDATPMAFAIALLWTLHPLQTEAVTYIIQRVESLMGLFYLLTLYCFIRGTECAADGGSVEKTKMPRHQGGGTQSQASLASWRLGGRLRLCRTK